MDANRELSWTMTDDTTNLWDVANNYLKEHRPIDALCYLAEIISRTPADRHARLALGVALGDAGNPAAALKVIRALAQRLVHEGYMLPAMVVIREGLERAGNDPLLIQILQGLHVRGVRAKAGDHLASPPALKGKTGGSIEAVIAEDLMALSPNERLDRAAAVGLEFPPAGPGATPSPMPLFCELETPAFVSTVKKLAYHRVPDGTEILKEGAPGDSLLVLVSGHVAIYKGGVVVGQLGAGSVLGEMALITRAARSATATATQDVEYFELGRTEVAELAKAEPKVLQELVDYCRRRLLLNLLRTSPLFSQFDDETRTSLLGQFRTLTIPAGQQIVGEGEAASGLYVVASGHVQVQAKGGSSGFVLLATLGPGDVFGEISLIKSSPTTASVIATDTVGAIVLPAAVFYQVVQQYPQVRQYLESLTADRLQSAKEAYAASGIMDADDLVVL